jgi:uncharacterized membrane protein
MSILAILAAIGSYFRIDAVPYVVSFVVITVMVLMALKKLPEKTFPILIGGLALSMILQQTMLGSYIVGTDIHGEYFIANKTITSGWDWSYFHLNVTSIVINIFTPFLDKIGIPIVWQFKLIYPIVLCAVPVILYFAFSKQFSKRVAFYSALFFMIVPVFTVEIAGIVKSMVAEVFFALTVYVLFSKISNLKKGILLTVFGILSIMCHYTVGTIVVAYLGAMGGGLLIYKFCTRKNNFVPLIIAFIIILVVGGIWLKSTGGSVVFTGYTHAFDAVKGKTMDAFEAPSSPSGSDIVESNSEDSYLNSQDSLVQTALGMDWNKVSTSGKAFRIIQYITQIAIIAGFIYLIVKRKKYQVSIEFLASIVASGVILMLVLFVPKLANIINTTRWYHFALFFISPLFVVALMQVGKEKLLVGVMIVYYIFTSGLVFEVAHSNVPSSSVEIPYSIAYSGDEGIVGFYNSDDVECAKWLVANRNDLKVHVSYTGTYLPLEFEDWSEQYQESAKKLTKPYLLFITTQDVELNKWACGVGVGLRSYVSLPNVEGLEELHRNGKGVVYYVR